MADEKENIDNPDMDSEGCASRNGIGEGASKESEPLQAVKVAIPMSKSLEERARANRASLISIVGIICAIFGFMGVVAGIAGPLMFWSFEKEAVYFFTEQNFMFKFMPYFFIAMGVADAFLLAGGIGLAKCKNWGRILVMRALTLTIVITVLGIGGSVLGIVGSSGSEGPFEPHPFGPTPASFIAIAIISGLVSMAIPVFIMIWLSTKKVKEICTSNVDIKSVRAMLHKKAEQNPEAYGRTVKVIAYIFLIIAAWFVVAGVIHLSVYNSWGAPPADSWQQELLSVYMVVFAIGVASTGVLGVIGSIGLARLKDFGRRFIIYAVWVIAITMSGFFVVAIISALSAAGANEEMPAAGEQMIVMLLIALAQFAVMVLLVWLLLRWLSSDRVKRACGKRTLSI